MTTTPIKIETLRIRNFKRIKVAELEFKPEGVTILGGENCQGKSTFLDAICALLGGKKYLPTNPHNIDANGATAVARIELSNGIEVELSGDKSTLKIKVDGKKGNQGTLKEFLNEFALDINKFMRATETDKGKMLIEHLGIGEQLAFLDTKIQNNVEERTVVGRDRDRKIQLAEACQTFENVPEVRVDVTTLMAELRRLEAENNEHQDRLDEMERIRNKASEKRAEIQKLEAEIAQLKHDHDEIEAVTKTFTAHDTASIESQINNASSINEKIDANAKAKATEEEAKAAKKEYQDLTDIIEESRKQRVKLIEEIGMPLAGLEIKDGALLYNGQAWDCMSGSERLKVATAISRAFKPECGFVLIDELEQMDWKTIKEFDAWAKAEGIQIIGAMVCDDDKAGENVIIIEDGRVKGAA